ANNKTTSRIAKFYDNVEVFHVPSDNPDLELNADRLPKDGMYLRCDRLTVFTRPLPGGKANQEMRAERNVFFRTEECFGRSDTVRNDERRAGVISGGTPGRRATLSRTRARGQAPEKIKGSKILYNRRTGEILIEGGTVLKN